MFIFLGILLTVLGFTVIVTIHELGHYFAARAVGVKVYEFGIGIPPRVATMRTDTHGTEWTLNALPIGWFVRLEGEDGHSQQTGSLGSRPLWARLLVLLAGVGANFLLAIILIALSLPFLDRPIALNTRFPELSQSVLFPSMEKAKSMLWITQSPGVIAAPVSEDTPFARSGGKKGDIITELNGQRVTDAMALKKSISESKTPFTVTVIRWSERLSLTISPAEWTMGAFIANRIAENPGFSFSQSFTQTIKVATREVWIQSVFTLHILTWLATNLVAPSVPENREEALEMVGGPIALGWVVVDMVSEKASVSFLLIMAALISVNLAVFNLLPLPALDGGRAITTILHSLASHFPARFLVRFESLENSWHFIGFAFLMLVSMLVAVKDIFSLFNR